jgi:hypothetical protein
MATPDQFSAEGLREVATDEFGTYVLHRHGGDHEDGTNCWCYPLVLQYIQVASLRRAELQQMLDAHYRKH